MPRRIQQPQARRLQKARHGQERAGAMQIGIRNTDRRIVRQRKPRMRPGPIRRTPVDEGSSADIVEGRDDQRITGRRRAIDYLLSPLRGLRREH